MNQNVLNLARGGSNFVSVAFQPCDQSQSSHLPGLCCISLIKRKSKCWLIPVANEITYQKLFTCHWASCSLGIHQWDHDCCFWMKLPRVSFHFSHPKSQDGFPEPRSVWLAKVLSPNLPPTSVRVCPSRKLKVSPKS